MFYSICFGFHGVSENVGTIFTGSSCDICEKDIYFFTNISKPDSCTCLFHSKCIENTLGVNIPCPYCNMTITNITPFTSSYSSIIQLYKERFADNLFQDQGNRKTLSIRGRHIFGDTLKKISRCLTNGLCSLKIDFIGEDKNDFGGPTREFFSEFFQSTVGRLVLGREMNYCFLHDSVGTLKGHFKSFWQIVTLTVAHGCHGPRFFSKTLVGYLVND